MEGLILEGKEISRVINNPACTGVGAGIFESAWIAGIRGKKGQSKLRRMLSEKL